MGRMGSQMTFKYGSIILIGLAVAAIAAPLPDLEDYLDADVETSVTAQDANGKCVKVCAKDKCKGTWTNPIPSGKKWFPLVGGKYDSKKGCCHFWSGACQTCCEKKPPPPTPAPTPKPTQAPVFTKCKAVCYKDKCKGTWTNPIPSGKKWTLVKTGKFASNNKAKGCCAFGKGACQNCCE